MLVQHLVVLEVVQERGRRKVGLAGEEHGRARHDVRQLLLEARQQCIERHFGAPRFLHQDIGAAPPGQDQQDHRGAEQQRCPGAFEQLEQVSGQERDVDHDQRSDDQHHAPERPTPQLPDHDEGQQAVDHHGGGDRDAVGGGERARRAEQTDQQQDAHQQGASHARDIDLSVMRRRGVQDRKPRQKTKVDGLMHQRIGASDHGRSAMTVAAVVSTTIGSSSGSGTSR